MSHNSCFPQGETSGAATTLTRFADFKETTTLASVTLHTGRSGRPDDRVK